MNSISTKEQHMREIIKPNGDVYLRVVVDEKNLKLQLAQYHNTWVILDAKIIPQLSDILKEATFFKHI